MKWYSKFLQVYEKPFSEAPAQIVAQVRANMERIQSSEPLITVAARKVGIRTDIIRGEDGSLALGLKEYGRIGFVRKRRARAITGYGTLSKDGSLLDSFKVRAKKALQGFGSLFTSRHEYKDDDTNLLK